MKQLFYFILTVISLSIFSFALADHNFALAGFGATLSAGGAFIMHCEHNKSK